MRKIDKIIIHCSATREGENYTVDTIRSWHVDGRGWSDIGYHFYIDLYGKIHKGRDIAKIGAHVKGHNRNSIGICYCGGVEADGKTPKKQLYTDIEISLIKRVQVLMLQKSIKIYENRRRN